MTNPSPSPRPPAAAAAAAVLILLSLLVLAPILIAGLRLSPDSFLARLGTKFITKPGFLRDVLTILLICPLAALLILRRNRAGQYLALALSGYVLLRHGFALLAPFAWIKPDPTRALQLLVMSLGVIALFGGLFYLLIRPEVFAYFRSSKGTNFRP